jgi:tetrahydromethanopterin S-methyltransferase subunit A
MTTNDVAPLPSASSPSPRALRVIREQIEEATAARKCHGCGCFQQTVRALADSPADTAALTDVLENARAAFVETKYDCLGCAVCYPAVAANAFTESFPAAGQLMDLCPTEQPAERHGWPPLAGDYRALRFGAPVAVCTLNSSALVGALASDAPASLAIVGSMHTENLGIERLIQNVTANPHVRVLVLCGEDTEQAVGHLPGQSLLSLAANGIDENGRILGARGKRPVIKNLDRDLVEAFRRQVTMVSLIGEKAPHAILAEVQRWAARAPGPVEHSIRHASIATVPARAVQRLVPDPAGYFVVYPERRTGHLQVEHFTNAGVLTAVIEGDAPAALYAEIIGRGLISRLDHAAYLGRELARAERALETGEPYVQDRAAGELIVPAQSDAAPSGPECGCATACGGTP